MRKIYMNKKKLVLTLCIAIPVTATAILLPRAVKNVKRGKHASV